jgi:hypothetical protein
MIAAQRKHRPAFPRHPLSVSRLTRAMSFTPPDGISIETTSLTIFTFPISQLCHLAVDQ